ncbi:MAG: sulfatase-like hydrolase/transferase [Planctomycetota bacterium]|nr:sulfatase-like hydrolase/transferase [Planctomycetota bacterium]
MRHVFSPLLLTVTVLLAVTVLLTVRGAAAGVAAERPNILWITSEDNGPHLGCYGDTYADTPRLDALARKGLRYLNAWSTAPVCAPARTTLISGIYPPSSGAEHMRSMTRLPEGMLMYPQYLRRAGYYVTNNNKMDYNLEQPGKVWDESSRRAHWKNRKPGQPFFAIFNHTVSHESRIRRRPHKQVHDPAKVRVPAYHPDTPEVRKDWAQYHDKLTEMDALAGKNLEELEEAGLSDDTIVFYYGDHGAGMPRSKRWPYNSGLWVPLIIHIPEKFRHLAPEDYRPGGATDRLVGFIDLAPTLLSLVGIEPPAHFQGHAFLGKHARPEQPFLHGFRGRMDERYDMVRTVRDKRYIYIRNYMPHKIYGQHVSYMFQTPTTRVWKRLYDEGKLAPPRTYFWERKPPEELYDLEKDPDEVRNLAGSPEHRGVLERLRKAQREHALAIRDVGFLPEDEIHTRSAGSSPYEMGHDAARYPLERIMKVAELASSLSGGALPALEKALGDDDSAVRYWGALGILMREEKGVREAAGALRKALRDPSPNVRVVAAEALARYASPADLKGALDVLLGAADLRENSPYVAALALNAIDELDGKARAARAAIDALPRSHGPKGRGSGNYAERLIEKILADLARFSHQTP